MKCWSCAEEYKGTQCPQCGAGDKPETPKAEQNLEPKKKKGK